MAREERRDRDDDRRERRRDDRDDDRGRGRDRGRDRDRRGGRRSYTHHKEENVRNHSEQSGGNWDGIFKSGVKAWRPKEGENAIRILPPTWENYDHYGFEVYVHTRVGASGSTYTCPNKHGGGPCAACAEVTALRAAGEDEDAGKLSVKKNFVYYILDRDAKKPEPVPWQVGWRQDKEIAEASEVKRRNQVKYIDHPDEGYDVFVKRTGKQLNTRYTYQTDSDPSPISDDPDEQDDILKEIEDNPISDLIVWASNEKIARDLEGTARKKDDDDDDDDDEGDRRGVRRGSRGGDEDGRSRVRSRDPDDDEDDRSSGGRRGRDRDDDEEDSTSRRAERRSRGRDSEREEDDRDDGEDRGRRRPRGRDDDGDEDRPRRRR
jgi:hypothetical protein